MKRTIAVIMMVMVAFSAFAGGSAESDGPVTITYYGRPDVELEESIIAAFEAENPDINVEYVELPSSSNDRLKTIQTVLQSQGTEMDVFAGDACWPAIFISAGWVTPLDEYISPSVRDSFISTMLTAYTFNGQTYGLPFMADVCALYYRDDLLSKYGLDVPETYDELLEASKTIMAGENNPDLYGWGYIGVQNETLACCFLSTYWALGGPDMVNEEGEFVFDYEIAEEAFELMRSFIYDEKVTPQAVGSFDTNTLRNMVMVGNIVFDTDWLSGYAKYNGDSSSVKGNMKIAAMPTNGAIGGWGVMVSAFSEHKEEAAKFAAFRANYESQLKALEMVDQVPTLNVFYDSETVPAGYEYLLEFLAPLSAARPRGLTPFYAAISSRIQIETSAVVTGMKTPAEAAESLRNGIQAVIG